jgi:glycosyltransferase involved in cell wall biosynthesis
MSGCGDRKLRNQLARASVVSARTDSPIVCDDVADEAHGVATPSVSIVLPVRNGAATIERALRSVAAQTLQVWEAVVVDDGSTDDTAALLDAPTRSDTRIRVLRQRALGIVAALNAGIEAARAPVVARLDADDEMHPTRLAAQLDALDREPQIGLISCLVEFGGDRGRSAGYALHVDWVNSIVTTDEIRLNRFIESPLAHPSVMFRRDLVDRLGGYRDGPFPEDYELWLRWLDAGVRMAKVPEPLLTWHDSPARLSRTDPRYDPEAFYRMKAHWVARELRRVAGSREIWVRGAGRTARRRAAALADEGVPIARFVDVDPRKLTPALGGDGPPVVEPGAVPSRDQCFILSYVGRRGARELIRDELLRSGRREGADFLLCA